jgi:hypothetical protein
MRSPLKILLGSANDSDGFLDLLQAGRTGNCEVERTRIQAGVKAVQEKADRTVVFECGGGQPYGLALPHGRVAGHGWSKLTLLKATISHRTSSICWPEFAQARRAT